MTWWGIRFITCLFGEPQVQILAKVKLAAGVGVDMSCSLCWRKRPENGGRYNEDLVHKHVVLSQEDTRSHDVVVACI
jgi:hypothetical protein